MRAKTCGGERQQRTRRTGSGRDRGRTRLPWASLAVAVFLAGCAVFEPEPSIETPHVSVADIRLAEIGLLEQRYSLALRIQNPNPVPVAIGGMEYRLSFYDQEFARGVSDRALTLPPYSERRISVDIVSGTGRLLEQLRRQAARRAGEPLYELRGALYLSDLGRELPFTFRGSLERPVDAAPSDESLL